MALDTRNPTDATLRGANAKRDWTIPTSQLRMRSLLAAMGVLGTVALGFAIGMALGVRGDDVTMLLLALLTLAIGCVPLVFDQGRLPWQRHIFISLVTLMFVAHYVTPALMLYIPAVGPIDASSTANTNLLPPNVIDGQLIALLGLVSLLGAYALPVGASAAKLVPKPRHDWSLPALLGVSVLMLAFGWTFSLALVFHVIPRSVGTAVFDMLATGNVYANALLTYAYFRHRTRIVFVPLAVNTILLFLFGMFTSRKLDMLIGGAVIILVSMIVTGIIRVRWVIVGLLAIVIVYPISELVRRDLLPYASVAELITKPTYTINLVSGFVGSGHMGLYLEEGFEATAKRIDGLGITSVIVRDTPSVSPFQHGRTLKLFFISFIPRIFWPDKPPVQIGKWITHVYGSGPYVDSNTAPTQIGEFYLNFGALGVVGGMLMLGLLLRFAHETLNRRGISAPTLLAQTIILVAFAIKFAAAVAGQYNKLVTLLVPLFLLHMAIRTFTRTIPVLPRERLSVAWKPPGTLNAGQEQ